MINIEYKSKRSNQYELQVRSIISTLLYSEDVEGAANGFEHDINKLSRSSTVAPADCYKLEWAEDRKSFTVWHRKPDGEKDRIVAVVSNK